MLDVIAKDTSTFLVLKMVKLYFNNVFNLSFIFSFPRLFLYVDVYDKIVLCSYVNSYFTVFFTIWVYTFDSKLFFFNEVSRDNL